MKTYIIYSKGRKYEVSADNLTIGMYLNFYRDSVIIASFTSYESFQEV